MLSESRAGTSPKTAGGREFWWRLTDNFFRRFVWFLLPILALSAFGVSKALETVEVYQTTGVLSTTTNPLVPEQPGTGAAAQYWETPAAATSRIINEQLRTDAFLAAVSEGAGLGPALESGLVTIDVVRSSVWASEGGTSILTVNAQWADAQTSYGLVTATIDQYETFLTETVASNSSEAETFWTEQLNALVAERDEAERVLTAFVADLPQLDENEAYPPNVQFELDRLSTQFDNVESKITDVQANIDVARLARAQQTTEAGRSFAVIDQPRVPPAPESTLMKRATLVASFMLLGMVIAAAALLVTTVLDQTVASSADLLAIGGISLVATVPPVRLHADGRAPRWRRLGSGRAARRRRLGSARRPRLA